MDDCKYKTEDCNKETTCPCLLFIKKNTEDYQKMLQSDLWKKIDKNLED